MNRTEYTTPSGIEILQSHEEIEVPGALGPVLQEIDTCRGAVLASGYEYPGRYSRWDLAFVNPPVEIVAKGREFTIRALNPKGNQILEFLAPKIQGLPFLERFDSGTGDRAILTGTIAASTERFLEEDRSKQPTVFSLLREIIRLLGPPPAEGHLGLYGAMGYELVFQFEPIRFRHDRTSEGYAAQPDLHLFLPDELYIVDRRKERAEKFRYDFRLSGKTTEGVDRTPFDVLPAPGNDERASSQPKSDHTTEEYAAKVQQVREGCMKGDYFEIVLSQTFAMDYAGSPVALFERIRERNPSPYEFLFNFGREQLVGASPEMFVRVENGRVETCPIAGTIARGASPIEDSEQIRTLLTSAKDESELTMCTDVDRNDKSRVCKPGTVEVVARKSIETYSKLFHTVDHVVGELRDDCDGLDALLSHMWACTLTGAPKPAALQTIEDLEKSARAWYGGCVGVLGFDGSVNTGITIRAIHLHDGEAAVRVGATLLADSDPVAEEQETRTKGAAFIEAIVGDPPAGKTAGKTDAAVAIESGVGSHVLFVDNRDSFVHTLAGYVRQTGAKVSTVRSDYALEAIDELGPDLVFISPGPGRPEEFGVAELVNACAARGLPVFGVCLGLQGMVQAFGGELDLLPYPVHGKPADIQLDSEGLFAGLPEQFTAGRYHSLCARPSALPDCLVVRARTDDGVIMAIEHRDLPAAAVQFHPESILSLQEDVGLRLLATLLERLTKKGKQLAEAKAKGAGNAIAS